MIWRWARAIERMNPCTARAWIKMGTHVSAPCVLHPCLNAVPVVRYQVEMIGTKERIKERPSPCGH